MSLKPVQRYRQCPKCGHINEHRVRWRVRNVILVTCSVCGFDHEEPPADAQREDDE